MFVNIHAAFNTYCSNTAALKMESPLVARVLYHADPILPGNHLVHRCEELLSPRPAAAIVIFVIRKTGLLIHGGSS